jgi:FKBP-type peptidyl-prolyl cis-trans isomerase
LKTSEPPCSRAVNAISIANVNQTQLQSDIQAIDAYLEANKITAVKDPSGLRYVVTAAGDENRPCIEKLIMVKYTGKLLSNGTVFDSSNNNPNTINGVVFPLYNLILGWQIALPKFGKGSKVTLYIPSGFGYGAVGSGTTIPPNSNLIFEIEVVDFEL